MQQQAMDDGWSPMPEQQARKGVVSTVGKLGKSAIGALSGGKGGMPRLPTGGKGGTPGMLYPNTFGSTGLIGLIGHNLSQDDRRREAERYLGMSTADWKDRQAFSTEDWLNRLTGGNDESLRMWDAMLPRRAQEFDQNLGFQQRMFDQSMPQRDQQFWQEMGWDKAMRNRNLKYQRLADERSWGNWDTGLEKIGGLTGALGLNE